MQAGDFKREAAMHITTPNRATHSYRQRLHAPPARVFPLLCPVRETEWVEGWAPELVISTSGVAERDCVFITPDKLGKAIWYVTRHEPTRWFVEMLRIVPGVTACRLEIQLSEDSDGCFADVSYSHTSIGPAGDEFVAAFTADYYMRFMQAWEAQLNHFLKTGSIDR
ncbi:MAG: hypothetical protein SNJ49_07890 [Chloracidobacterium sp.]